MGLKILTPQEIEKLSLKEVNDLIKQYGTALNQQLKELKELEDDARLAREGIDFLRHRANESLPVGSRTISGLADSFDLTGSTELELARAKLRLLVGTYASQKASITGLRAIRAKSLDTFNFKHETQLDTAEYADLQTFINTLMSAGWSSQEAVDLFYTEKREQKFHGNWQEVINWATSLHDRTDWESEYFNIGGRQDELTFSWL